MSASLAGHPNGVTLLLLVAAAVIIILLDRQIGD